MEEVAVMSCDSDRFVDAGKEESTMARGFQALG